MATMTLAKYRATVRKLHVAYEALKVADATAEHFDAEYIARAMDAMRRVPDALRVQVCKKCSPTGYYTSLDDPYTSLGCEHPDVPKYDIRLGIEPQRTDPRRGQ